MSVEIRRSLGGIPFGRPNHLGPGDQKILKVNMAPWRPFSVRRAVVSPKAEGHVVIKDDIYEQNSPLTPPREEIVRGVNLFRFNEPEVPVSHNISTGRFFGFLIQSAAAFIR